MEKNLATGEETRISQRGQEFQIHSSAPDDGALSMEAASPTARSYEARSHEAAAGPAESEKKVSKVQKTGSLNTQDTGAYKASNEGFTGQHSVKKARNRHPNTPETTSDRPSMQREETGRLQFSADEKPPDAQLTKLQEKSDKRTASLEKARGRLPTKKRIKSGRVFDEATGKAKTKLSLEKEVIPKGVNAPAAPVRAGQKAGRGAKQMALNQYHKKINEVEHENVGVKALHKGEQAVEESYRGGKSARTAFRFVKDTPYRRVAKLEKKAAKANIRLDYRKALQENPKLKSNLLSRLAQKQKIKREYAKAARQAQKAAGKTAKKTGEILANATKALFCAIKSNPGVAAAIGAIGLAIVFLVTSVSSCSNLATGGMGVVMGNSYLAPDTEIDAAEIAYTQWETDLQIQVNQAETTHGGYDEYRYNVGDIGHNPYELMAFLTAKYGNFTYSAVQAELQQIFSEQYQLSFVEETETRYNDPNDENEDGDLEEYEWHILYVNLTAYSFTGLVTTRLSAQEQGIYTLLMQSKGNRQYAYSPFDFNWLPYVSCYYGWRVHPITGEADNHKAVDIAVAQGTPIIAAHDGTVTTAASDSSYGNYIVLDDGKGLVTKYAHCSVLSVSAGQTVSKGDAIASVGNTGDSTGPHLHFEVLKNGQNLNPLYFAVTNDDGSGSLLPGSPGGPEYPAYPGSPLGDGSYAALIAEAELHLGKRYVFGASGPANFDCSSFVCWVLDKSGVKPMGRTTAQGLYNMSTPVSPAEARPGDLIFFSGTYSTPNACSHVGIYMGNGMMIHAGDPIQYTSINTAYWQQHFYAFARIT